MTIEQTQAGDKIVLRVVGRMDAENAPLFKAKCEACILEGARNLVIDLGDLAYVSSMGLGCFVSIAKTIQDKGGVLRVCRPGGLVKQVFEITGMNRVVRVHESLESALIGH